LKVSVQNETFFHEKWSHFFTAVVMLPPDMVFVQKYLICDPHVFKVSSDGGSFSLTFETAAAQYWIQPLFGSPTAVANSVVARKVPVPRRSLGAS